MNARHTLQEHREKDAVNRNQRAPEVNAAQKLAHLATSHFGVPEVHTSKETEDGSGSDHVVKMADHVISIMQEKIDSVKRERDPRQPAQTEHRQEGGCEQHRSVEPDGAAPKRHQQGCQQNHGRNRDHDGGHLEEGRDLGTHSCHVHVVGPHNKGQEAQHEHRVHHRLVPMQRLASVVCDDLGDDPDGW